METSLLMTLVTILCYKGLEVYGLPSEEILHNCFNHTVGISRASTIHDNQMTATSQQGDLYQPAYGRLNGARGGGWCAEEPAGNDDWLQVDLGESFELCGVATQGNRNGNEWTTHFKLSYSPDGINWTTYKDPNGLEAEFHRTNSTAVEQHKLLVPVGARYIRFQPTKHHVRKCLRVEAYGTGRGCQYGELGMGNGYILDRDIASSSVKSASTPAKNARLNYNAGSAWCASTDDSKAYLQINLDRLYIICAVATQGNPQGDQWVNKYTLQSSTDGTTWTSYQEGGITRIFNGNFDRNTTVKQILCDGFLAQRLRIIVQDKYGGGCMRAEIYGVQRRQVSGNLAREKPADQSSVFNFLWDSSDPSYAVDGDKNTIPTDCALTDISNDPWWRVDLERSEPVAELYVLNILDTLNCCGEPLNGFDIRVGNSTANGGVSNQLCARDVRVPEGEGRFLRCNNTVFGRYVFIRVLGNDKVLTLCEVEVYSAVLTNIALNQPASQSSTKPGEVAGRAVDGKPSTCVFTLLQRDPWWRVDIGVSLPVAEVVIVGMTCAGSCGGFNITVGDDNRNESKSNTACGGPQRWQGAIKQSVYCLPRLLGQFVLIQIFGANKNLSICEVEIYAYDRTRKVCQTQAVDAESFQASSSRRGSEPDKGQLNGNGAWSPSSDNDANDYLQINLGDVFFICAVATQANPLVDEWTTSYKLILLFGTEWVTYKENGREKIFKGNSGRKDTVRHDLVENVKAQFVRFQPVQYSTHKALRVAVYGTKIPAGLPSPPVIENKKNKVAFSELNLVWSSPDSNGCSLTMYTIYYRKIQSPGTPWHRINATAATNSMSAFPLECDTQYEFAVTAWNKLGESELSQSWQVRSTTGYPIIVGHKKEIGGSAVVVTWKACAASFFTIYHREVLSGADRSDWKPVNVSGHETSHILRLSCQKEYEIAITAWSSTAETPLNHSKIWRVATLGGKPSAPIIQNKKLQASGCNVNLGWSIPEDNGCPLTMYTIHQRILPEDIWHQINVSMDTRSFIVNLFKCDTKYTYMLAVSAWNEIGESDMSSQFPITSIKVVSAGSTTGRDVGIAVGCSGILIVMGIICFRKRRKTRQTQGYKRKRSKSAFVTLQQNEIPPERVTFTAELGRGAFGKVHKAVLREFPGIEVFNKPREQRLEMKEEKVVAVKVLLETAGEEGKAEFLREIELMKQIGSHRNVLSMLGYWVKSEPVMMILEYVPYGDLLQWLRNKRQQIKLYANIDAREALLKDNASSAKLSDAADVREPQKEVDTTRDQTTQVTNLEPKDSAESFQSEFDPKKGTGSTTKASGEAYPQNMADMLTTTGDGTRVKKPSVTSAGDLKTSKQDGEEIREDKIPLLNSNTHVKAIQDESHRYENAEVIAQSRAKAKVDMPDDYDNFDAKDLLSFAWQVAKGMDFLACRGFVHRDLAARNVLLGEGKTVKIADFGLLRNTENEIYEVKLQRKLPIKWMAPEALHDGIFTTKSDVWSFGVVLWELSTMGGIPYPGISNKQMYKLVTAGYRMDKPDMCSDELYALMSDCWKEQSDERPSFAQVITALEELMTGDTPYYDFNKLDENEACYDDELTSSDEAIDQDTKL